MVRPHHNQSNTCINVLEDISWGFIKADEMAGRIHSTILSVALEVLENWDAAKIPGPVPPGSISQGTDGHFL